MAHQGRPTVTLLTDFGSKDSFVGVMKGVILSVAPRAVIVDLCHGVAAQDVLQASFLLASSYRYFPHGTIHVAVVDPGVGTARRILALQAKGYFFVVPDNGIIVPAVRGPEDVGEAVSVENDAYFLKPLSATFHGRDIFAPVAAYIARGVPLRAFGPPVSDFNRGSFPAVKRVEKEGGTVLFHGTVIHVDSFGNLITNIRMPGEAKNVRVVCAGHTIEELSTTYAHIPEGQLGAVIGSSMFVEIAAPYGSAAEILGVSRGESVQVELRRVPK